MKLLTKREADEKNTATSFRERERYAVHELTHHLIAEHYGLPSTGIELGYRENDHSCSPAVSHFGDCLKRKHQAGEHITPDEHRAFIHAVLSNGYGDESVFGTPPELRGDEADVHQAHRYMDWIGYTLEESEAFEVASIDKTRQILSDPAIQQVLRTAGEKAAREYWGNGKVIPRDVVNKWLNIKEEM